MKKSQIAIFLIVGAILLVGGVSSYFLFSDDIDVFIDIEDSGSVNFFVEKCLITTTENALLDIGSKGGWYYSENRDYTSSFNTDKRNREAKGVSYLDVFNIDYWFYFDDEQNTFVKNIPEYDTDSDYSIKTQIRRYIFEKIENTCIRNFYALNDIYSIQKKSDIKIDIDLEPEVIHVYFEYPLEILEKATGEVSLVESFYIKVPNTIVVPYNLAKDIVETQSSGFFLDKTVLSILSSYTDSDSREYLPPFYDFTPSYDAKPWNLKKAKEKTKQLLNINLPILEFKSTYRKNDNYLISDSPYAMGVRDMYKKNFLASLENEYYNDYQSYEVKSIYEVFFPSFVSFTDNPNDIILSPRAESVLGILPIFFTKYMSSWDMTFPVLFEIKDKSSNRFYEFKFFIETNIRDNLPLKESIVNSVTTNVPSFGNSLGGLICEEDTFIGNYTIELFDPTLNQGVDEAYLFFDCKGITSCNVGTTKIDNDGISKINFNLPRDCNPGKLTIKKLNHQTLEFNEINPREDSVLNWGRREMHSLKEFTLRIDLSGEDMENAEGFLSFENLEDEELSRFVSFNETNINDLKIELVPAEYSIFGLIILNETVIIPEDEICDTSLVGQISGGNCETLEEMTLDQWFLGSYNFEADFTDMNLEKNKIELEFNTFTKPNSYDSLGDLTLDEESEEPIFK